ncbi:sugar-binding transcriptional regulator [Ruania alba]|uniref:DNA-binding transcriptional regulator LsrR, DeoR family n=1 Tax=Ruania alba TaxID=648782 RepID=A0A1H5KR91_9MICO|nr:sugar-binding transcriptional regulator [Ruania alba]SEE67312.1 DNA-binding transcriptional regulator LsrR, DeoR family [Ruania alba]
MPTVTQPASERLSLLTKVALMYHEQGVLQPEIAERLHISQSRVSRLLKEAVQIGVVRTIVVPPAGVHAALEQELKDAFGLADVVIADVDETETGLLSALGSAAAGYLETTLTGKDRVGISSWSSTLLATVEAMTPRNTRAATDVVQVLGGVGRPNVQVQATQLADRLARVTKAVPRYLPAPGIVAGPALRDALLAEPYAQELVQAWDDLTVVLAGIGSVQPSPLLLESGNALGEEELARLRDLGAVGDVCLRFYDTDGAPVVSDLDDRVVGIGTEQLKAVPRTVGVAGGERKWDAIRGAVRGGWVDVLITDSRTARYLLGG